MPVSVQNEKEPLQSQMYLGSTVKRGYFDQNSSNKFIYSYILCSGCFSLRI